MKRFKQRGFTIVEMIVVIAVIAVLFAILVPSLRSTQSRARKVKEAAKISEVGKAWQMYLGDHQDKILPGYLSTKVQEYRKLAWALPDESLVFPAPTYDYNLPNNAGPWTWRLLNYLDYDWRSLLNYRDTDEWTTNDIRDYSSVIATEPAFGYNGFYLGGWWSLNNHSNKPEGLFSSVQLTDGNRANMITSTSSAIKKPSSQIVFCSTFYASQGVYQNMPNDTPGSYFAAPSILARVTKWVPLSESKLEVRVETFAPLGRGNGPPVITNADGSTKTITYQELVNQQLWIPRARTIGDIPASEFSHTVD
jgi:prepilin-type N-terminal cleavage/methylation domain-containing protein